MKLTSAALIGIFSFLLLHGCYYDSEEALYPEIVTSCDTLNVSYNSSVVHIFESNCYSCHSSSTSSFGGGINLQNKNTVLVNASKIKASVSHVSPKPMPPSGKLSDCDIAKLEIWIRNGMSTKK
jgi:uncharacterized membrane protein